MGGRGVGWKDDVCEGDKVVKNNFIICVYVYRFYLLYCGLLFSFSVLFVCVCVCSEIPP